MCTQIPIFVDILLSVSAAQFKNQMLKCLLVFFLEKEKKEDVLQRFWVPFSESSYPTTLLRQFARLSSVVWFMPRAPVGVSPLYHPVHFLVSFRKIINREAFQEVLCMKKYSWINGSFDIFLQLVLIPINIPSLHKLPQTPV